MWILLSLALAIPASSVEPEPSCERQAVEAIRPAVERTLRMGRSYAEGYYVGYNSELAVEAYHRTMVALLHQEMKEFERECLRRREPLIGQRSGRRGRR